MGNHSMAPPPNAQSDSSLGSVQRHLQCCEVVEIYNLRLQLQPPMTVDRATLLRIQFLVQKHLAAAGASPTNR